MAVRAVLFDLDLTLWRIASGASELAAAELRAMVRSHQVQRVLGALRDAAGENMPAEAVCEAAMTFLDDLWASLMAGNESADDLREVEAAALLLAAIKERGFEASAEVARAVWAASYVPYPHFPLELYDDTLSTLDSLRDRGLRMAVVTNSPWPGRVRQPDIGALGLGEYVNAVVSSGDVGYRKPHAFVFERALAAIGVEPREAVMVGDSLVNDVLGAQKLGITGVWKRNGRGTDDVAEADFVISDLNDLLALPLF